MSLLYMSWLLHYEFLLHFNYYIMILTMILTWYWPWYWHDTDHDTDMILTWYWPWYWRLHPAIPKHRYSDRSLPLFGMGVFPHRKIDTVIPMVTRRLFETLLFRKITPRNGGVSNFLERPCHSEYIIIYLYIAIAQLEMSIHAQFGDPLGQLLSQWALQIHTTFIRLYSPTSQQMLKLLGLGLFNCTDRQRQTEGYTHSETVCCWRHNAQCTLVTRVCCAVISVHSPLHIDIFTSC